MFDDETLCVALRVDRLPWEVISLNVGDYIHQAFVQDILPNVEQEVGALFVELLLGDFLPVEVVVFVPFAIECVLCEGDIVSKAKSTIVVHHSMQVILSLYIECVLEEALVLCELGQV